MRNYKIKYSKRNIKKVFKRVFGEGTFLYWVHGHAMKPRYFSKSSVGLMRYMLVCHWC